MYMYVGMYIKKNEQTDIYLNTNIKYECVQTIYLPTAKEIIQDTLVLCIAEKKTFETFT